jgi:photosystem II stability/assembly factor-like uncharacterized protein
LFFSSAVDNDGDALGLLKSNDDGVHWDIISEMEGISVRTLAFHSSSSQKMVLGTSDGRVYQSTNSGDTWVEVAKPPIDDIGVVTYNPFVDGEVWVAGAWLTWSSGIVKSLDNNLTGWVDVAPENVANADSIDFTSATSVYLGIHWVGGYHSDDDGQSWQPFGPSTGAYDITFSQSNIDVMYMGGYKYGVHKTIDGGQNWEVKNQGLSAMIVTWIEAPKDDRRHVYAIINGWNGVFRSDDSAASWEFIPIEGSWGLERLRVDPFGSQHLYLAADTGFYNSPDGGTTWIPSDLSQLYNGMVNVLAGSLSTRPPAGGFTGVGTSQIQWCSVCEY